MTPLRLAPVGPAKPKTYSNPLGATLVPIREGRVWLAERPFYPRLPGLQNVDVACKSAIVKLGDGSLWVHAPVGLDDETRRAVDALGPVEHVVSPNAEHVKYAQAWIDAYPDALACAAPGLAARFPNINWQAVCPPAPDAWLNEFECAWIDAERAPLGLLGDRPFFSEVVFCHTPSRVLFVTDLWWNYPADAPRLWKFGMDQIYRPVYNNLMRKRPQHDAILHRILDWDFDYVVPCHGEPIAGPTVKATLRAFFDMY